MKSVLRSATLAFALTTLYLLNLTGPLVSPDHDLTFHFPDRALAIFVPVFLDILIVWLLLTAILHTVTRHRRAQLLVWSALLLPVPSVLLATLSAFAGYDVPAWATTLASYLPVLLFILVCVQRRPLTPLFRRARPVIESFFAFIAISGLIIVAELLWFGWQARDNNAPPVLHQVRTHLPAQPRFIWIILDELSQDQLYDHRFPGLDLPAFDRFAAQSTMLTHVVAANEFTRAAVPSLLTGHALDETRQSSNGRTIAMQDQGSKQWSRLDPQDSLFGDALAAGYSTGVAGWYEPYCRIFPAVLDRCFWIYGDTIPGEISGHHTFLANVIHSLADLGVQTAETFNPSSPTTETDQGRADVKGHYADYHALLLAGDQALSDPNNTFLYLHMPIPHPWGFYDRHTHTFPPIATSYLDNLALADLYLAHVRELLEKQHQWDSSTIVIMGDHSWRSSFVWAKSSHWTPEEEIASRHADYDERPAYLLKLPNQQSSCRIDTPFEAAHTRPLFQGLLTHHIQTPNDLGAWIQEHP